MQTMNSGRYPAETLFCSKKPPSSRHIYSEKRLLDISRRPPNLLTPLYFITDVNDFCLIVVDNECVCHQKAIVHKAARRTTAYE